MPTPPRVVVKVSYFNSIPIHNITNNANHDQNVAKIKKK